MAAHCSVCVCVCVCVCAIGWVKCRAQIPSMDPHTWPHITSFPSFLLDNWGRSVWSHFISLVWILKRTISIIINKERFLLQEKTKHEFDLWPWVWHVAYLGNCIHVPFSWLNFQHVFYEQHINRPWWHGRTEPDPRTWRYVLLERMTWNEKPQAHKFKVFRELQMLPWLLRL